MAFVTFQQRYAALIAHTSNSPLYISKTVVDTTSSMLIEGFVNTRKFNLDWNITSLGSTTIVILLLLRISNRIQDIRYESTLEAYQ
jgi:hypothetical protein